MKQRAYYDVALSFAGEDRQYVEKVFNVLHQLGVKVFYDDYHKIDSWGKDLYTHLDNVYRVKSRFCVIFISKFYKKKLLTNHERMSAQARAIKRQKEYILPARFDKMELPGLRPTTAYIDLQVISPEDFAYMILEKIGKKDEIGAMINYLKQYLDYDIVPQGEWLHFRSHKEKMIGNNGEEDFEADFPLRLMLEMYRADQLMNMFLLPALVPH